MIPQFDALGNLPQGVYNATLEEVRSHCATTPHRLRLYEALSRVIDILREANCPEVHLNGSYVTAAAEPGDYTWSMNQRE